MIFDLVKNFADVLQSMPSGHPKYRILKLLNEAIRREIHFIDRHPTTLFQCMWNSCWWYDCPEAAQHYDPPDQGWSLGGPPWARSGKTTSELLESWRTDKESSTPGFRWIHSLRPPIVPLSAVSVRVFPQPEQNCVVSHVAFSADGVYLATAYWDGTIRVWEIDSTKLVSCLRGHKGEVFYATFSRDVRFIVSGGADGTVRVWNAIDGRQLACLLGHEQTVISGTQANRFAPFVPPDAGDTVVSMEGEVWATAFSPDGRYIASGSLDTTVRIWDANTATEVACLRGHAAGVLSVAFSPDGNWLASASRDKTICIWNVANGDKLYCIRGHNDWVGSIAFSPDGQRLVSASGDHTLRLWNSHTWDEVALMQGHEDAVHRVAFSSDGQALISCSGSECTMIVWDANTGIQRERYHGRGVPSAVIYLRDGRLLAASNGDGYTVEVWEPTGVVRLARLRGTGQSYCSSDVNIVAWTESGQLWNVLSGRQTSSLHGHQQRVYKSIFSSDGSRVASASEDGTLRIWELRSSTQIASFDLELAVGKIAFSPDGRQVADTSITGTVRIWKIEGEIQHAWLTALHGVTLAAFFPGGDSILCASNDGTVRFWPLGDPFAGSFRKYNGVIKCVVFSPQQELVVSGLLNGAAWVLRQPGHAFQLPRGSGQVRDVALSNDATRLISSDDAGTITVWDCVNAEALCSWKSPSTEHTCVAISRDGLRFATASEDRMVYVWDTVQRKLLACLHNDEGGVVSLAISPDSGTVAVGCVDGVVRIWNLNLGGVSTALIGHEGPIRSISFSEDSRRIVSGSDDRTVRVWNSVDGNCLACLRAHWHAVTSVAFSLDGRRIVSAARDAVRIWDGSGYGILYTYHGDEGAADLSCFSPDSQHLAYMTDDSIGWRHGEISAGPWRGGIHVWDVQTCTHLWSMRRWSVKGERLSLQSFSADGLGLFIRVEGGTSQVCDTATGSVVENFGGIAYTPTTTLAEQITPWRAVVEGTETLIKSSSTEEVVAWFPKLLGNLRMHPTGRTWADGPLHIFRLEGE